MRRSGRLFQMRRLFILNGIVLLAIALTGLSEAWAYDNTLTPRLVAPAEIVVGDLPGVRAVDLDRGQVYLIDAEMIDVIGRKWSSSAEFTADQQGVIDLARTAPTSGDYSGIDPFGMLWSMKMQPATDADKPFDPPLDLNTIKITLSQGGRQISDVSIKQWVIPRGVSSEKIGDGMVAELYFDDKAAGRRPGILLLGGSGGGLYWAKRQAALLAKEGYVALALSYFNYEGLPKHLAQIPIEYVDRAVDILANNARTDRSRLAIMGYSKGAELALFVSSRRTDIKAVVAYAPASAVFQGFKPPEYPVLSSWTLDGKDVPFVPNSYDKKFFATRDGMYLWYRTLKQYDEMEKAAIPVENISGEILLLSGAKDQIWPSTLMGEQIIGRLRLLELKDKCTHVVFGDAGHGIAAPPGEPLTRVADSLGGTAAGNARARLEGWQRVKEFLKATLNSSGTKVS